MPICNDNFNGCFTGSYYPRPIFNCCPTGSCGGGSSVVNPSRSEEWGFFAVQNTEVSFLEAVPVALVGSAGSAVSQTQTGEIALTAGSYVVSYTVTGSSSASPIRFALELGGDILPYSLTTETGDGNPKTMSTSVIITTSGNAVLRLVSQTDGVVTVSNANVAVTKLLN